MTYRCKILLSFLLLPFTCFAQTEPVYSYFKGKVKSVKENSYAANEQRGYTATGKFVRTGKPKREYAGERDFEITYDTLGRKTGKTLYKLNGKTEFVITYNYDANGFLTKEIIRDRKQRLIDSTVYANHYNTEGKIMKRIVTRRVSSMPHEFIYEHDAEGNIYELYVVGQGTPVKTRDSRRYNKNWQVTTSWTYTGKGNPDWKHTFTYDENGRLIADSGFVGWNKLAIIYKWKYNEKGELIRREICNPSGLNCEAWTFVYKYDSKGNWTWCEEYRNGKAMFVKVRNIIYY